MPHRSRIIKRPKGQTGKFEDEKFKKKAPERVLDMMKELFKKARRNTIKPK